MSLIIFSLQIKALDNTYIIAAQCDPVGESQDYSLDRAHLVDLTAGLTEPNHLAGDPERMRSFGSRLFQLFFQGQISEHFGQAHAIARERNTPLRLVIASTRAPELHEIPWELLHNGRHFLALTPLVSIARYVNQPSAVRNVQLTAPLRILLTTASPDVPGLPPLDVRGVAQSMRDALEEHAEHVELKIEHRLSFDRLRHLLARHENLGRPFHIWHHVGHSSTQRDAEGNHFRLVLHDEDDVHEVAIKRIEAVVQLCPSLRAIVLNTCQSADTTGLAPALAALGVPMVIGFRGPIDEAITRSFIEHALPAWLTRSLDVAVTQARHALWTDFAYSGVWAAPQVFLRTHEAVLLAAPAPRTAPSTSTPATKFGTTIGKMVANHVEIIGELRDGRATGAEPGTPPAPAVDVEVRIDEVKTDTYRQIAQLTISDEEALRRFLELQRSAREIAGDA